MEKSNDGSKLNIYQKLLEVRKGIEYLQKSESGQNCKYTAGSIVVGTIRPKIDELGLLLIPKITSSEYSNVTVIEGKDNKEKLKHIVKCDMVYTWINVENPDEQLDVPFVAYGMQNDISMAQGSALTYIERYFLLKFFQIATDKDDPDMFENKVSKKTKVKKEITNDSPDFDIFVELENLTDAGDVIRFRKQYIDKVKDKQAFINAINAKLSGGR